MKIQTINNYSQKNNTNFGSLRKISCYNSLGKERPCDFWGNRISDELKKLAKKNNFFKQNDIDAKISVVRYKGAMLVLEYKPVAKTFVDKIKNIFTAKKTYILKAEHCCPDDSSFVLAKKIRSIKNDDKEFLTQSL